MFGVCLTQVTETVNQSVMDRTVFVILLLTASYVPSASFPNIYHFIREKMTWTDAHAYCITEHTALAQIQDMKNVTTMMNTPTGGYTGKAWVGLYEDSSEWTWLNGGQASYVSWASGQQDTDNMCVAMDDDGYWFSLNCSQKHVYVCHTGADNYIVTNEKMTWNDSETHCRGSLGALVSIINENINSDAQQEVPDNDKAWIGLSRTKLWYWSKEAQENFSNWQNGQPDGTGTCAAVVLTDGTWTDEQCLTKYPFFCSGVYKSRQTVMRMKFKSSANMEDPAYSADLLQQLRAALANQGLTDFKMTWKKQPVKQTQESSDDKDAC